MGKGREQLAGARVRRNSTVVKGNVIYRSCLALCRTIRCISDSAQSPTGEYQTEAPKGIATCAVVNNKTIGVEMSTY